MTQPSKMTPALIGGASLGVASGIPFINLANCACCAWVIGGGVLAAYLWQKNAAPSPAPPYGDGILLGLLTGVVGIVVSSIVSLPFTLMGAAAGGFGSLEQIEEAFGDQQIPPALQQAFEAMGGAGIGIGSVLIGLIFGLVIYPIFAAIGATIGTALFHKKAAPPTMSAPIAPPAPPTT